ncbi:MAG: hypothetical protein ACO1QB_02755 [Verrucomicrobiales bacterium]
MPGPTGILDQLNPEQQEELFELLCSHTTKEVLQKISAPPPEGWGIDTHLTSLRRFYQRKQLEFMKAELEDKSSLHLSAPDAAALKKGALAGLTASMFHASRSPQGNPRQMERAFQLFIELEKLEQARERLKLDKERLEFERAKIHAQKVLQSVKNSDAFSRQQMDLILAQFNALLESGFLEPNYWNPKNPPSGASDADLPRRPKTKY